jgi:phosphate:Na+ symporter
MAGMRWFLHSAFGMANPDDPKNVTLAIALYHTTFNIVNTLVVLPFTGKIPALLDKLFPNKVVPKHAVVTKLDPALIKSPFAAITQSAREMNMMNDTVRNMLKDLRLVLEGKADKKVVERIFEAEEKLDMAQTEVISFLTGLLSTSVSKSIANDAERQLRMSYDLETASDYVTHALKLCLRLRDHNVAFDKLHQEGLISLHDAVSELADDVALVLNNSRDVQVLAKVRREGHEITEQVRDCRAKHWSHVAEVSEDPLLTTTFTDLLGTYRKIKEHLVTATQALGAEIIDDGSR